jgi:hypothetical protein
MHVQTHQLPLSGAPVRFKPPQVAPSWALLYAVEGFPVAALASQFRRQFPNSPLFGTTSFRGVFTPAGFLKGAAMLLATPADGVTAVIAARSTGPDRAREAASSAAQELLAQLGDATPSLVMMHATPGFEENVIEGIGDALGSEVPVYGGSAADEELAGRWSIFANDQQLQEGFVLTAFCTSPAPGGARSGGLHGGFLDGYLPTSKSGRVTRASGRTLYQIDGQPAAHVYNEWTGGAIAAELEQGGNVLTKTNLRPLARIIDTRGGLPRRLLSHPHEVLPDGAMSLFTGISAGDEVELMIGTTEPLIQRIDKVVERALPRRRPALRGGVLIYCGGCLAALEDRSTDIAQRFSSAVGGVPFIGAATFGEQGALAGPKNENRHGNLMCSALLIE